MNCDVGFDFGVRFVGWPGVWIFLVLDLLWLNLCPGSWYLVTVVFGLVCYCSFGVSGLVDWFCCLSGSSGFGLLWIWIWVVWLLVLLICLLVFGAV